VNKFSYSLAQLIFQKASNLQSSKSANFLDNGGCRKVIIKTL